MKLIFSIALSSAIAIGGIGHANASILTLMGAGGSTAAPAVAPQVLADPEIAGLDFPNNGVTAAVSGSSTTLTVKPGQYSGSVISRSYNWHTVSAPTVSLGTGAQLTLSTISMAGQAIEVAETVSGLAGSLTRTSDWFGTIETSAPVLASATTGLCSGASFCIPRYDLQSPAPTTLAYPGDPQHFLQCYGPGTYQHAIIPGAAIPPCSPNTDPAHVWVFAPTGTTYNAQVAAGVPTASIGHAGHPFSDVTAILNSVSGYPSALLGTTIPYGDTLYIEPGWSTPPIITGGNIYSTSTGAAAGTPIFTWIMGDPAAASKPVLQEIYINNGAGLIFNHLRAVWNHPEVSPYNTVTLGGAQNIHLEDIDTSSNSGDNPNDPFPQTGGTSDGQVTTAAASFSNSFSENGVNFTATAAKNSQTINATADLRGVVGWYIWSYGYAPQGILSGPTGNPTGIPNGTIVTGVNGVDRSVFKSTRTTVNGLVPSDLTSATPNNGTVSSTASMTGTTGYWILATSSTALQTVYVYNGSAWASVGLIPPQTWATTNAVIYAYNTNHMAKWSGSAWVDLGTTYINIAPCSATTDAQTGCPTTAYTDPVSGTVLTGANNNVPGCDPYMVQGNVVAGGCNGAPVAWNGTTKALLGTAADRLTFSDYLTIEPKGAYSGTDLFNDLQDGFSVNASSYVSIKNSSARLNQISYSNTNNTGLILYNDTSKFTSGDANDMFSNQLLWTIRFHATDPTILWYHQDCVQLATANGTENITYYNNAVVRSECFQFTDNTNPFPKEWQGINVTDDIYSATYIGDNTVIANTNGIGIGGIYNVITNNTMIGSNMTMGGATKSAYATPFYSVQANNVATGINRTNNSSQIANPCGSPGDGAIVEGNVSLSYPISPFVTSLDQCAVGSTTGLSYGATAGPFAGVGNWTAADWRSGQAGVTGLFKGYDPLPLPTFPATGYGIEVFQQLHTCVHGSIPPIGACTDGAAGSLNLRPNPSYVGVGTGLTFAGTAAHSIGGYFCSSGGFPATAADGSYWYATSGNSSTGCGPTSPAGVWQYCASSGSVCTNTTPFNASFPNWVFVSGGFTPGIIGAGVAHQYMPIADHDGKAWANPPSVGAYESH